MLLIAVAILAAVGQQDTYCRPSFDSIRCHTDNRAPIIVPQPTPQQRPGVASGKELYVGCRTFARSGELSGDDGTLPFNSAAYCGLAIHAAFEAAAKAPVGDKPFCLPKTAEARDNPYRSAAYAYIDFYEMMDGRIDNKSSVDALYAALVIKWPCPS